MSERPRILFVCARNQWRSPTAEAVYRDDPRVEVRSAGLSAAARRVISRSDVEWADLIFVMERAHARRLRERFENLAPAPRIHVLDIPDDYSFLDAELVELVRLGVEPVLAGLQMS